MKGSGLLKFILWAAACLLLAVSPGFSFAQPPALPEKVGPMELEDLVSQAEQQGWSLMVLPHPWLEPWMRENPERANRWWQLPVRRVGNVVWVGTGQGVLHWGGEDSERDNDLRKARRAAVTSVGKALLASLSAEQMDVLLHNRVAEDILDAYNYAVKWWGELGGVSLEVAGFLPGDRMTDSQRQVCGLAVCISNLTYNPDWLASARFAYAGFHSRPFVTMGGQPWSIFGETDRVGLQLVVDSGPVSVAPSLRYARSRKDRAPVDADLPAERFAGQRLAELVEWAQANAAPEVEEGLVEVPLPEFRHITAGPTKDVTSLLTPEEAEMYVDVPSDVIYTQRAVAEMFQTMGITVTGATQQTMEPLPAGPKGELERYTLCQLLNYIMRDSSRNGYFVREGNTFRMVEDWEVTGRYCLDPFPLLPPEGLDKPITLTMKRGRLRDLLPAIREQTSLPVLAGSGAEGCKTPITVVLKAVPAREVLESLNESLSPGWERLSDGSLVVVPRGCLSVRDGRRVTAVQEVEQHCQKMARMTLALFMEALSPAHQQRVQEDGLTFGELTGPARELAVAAAQLTFGVPNPDQEAIALRVLGQEEDGSWQIRLWVGSVYRDLTTLAVPTIPPNPVLSWRWPKAPARPSRRVVDITGLH